MKRSEFAFYDFNERTLPYKVVFIVGPCRSGKSSLGRLAGSQAHHFHIEEDWWLLMLPILCREGRLDRKLFVNAVRAWIAETVYDAALMRRASFRPSDHSFIGRMKSEAEIARHLKGLRSRADVDAYFRDEKVTFIFNLAEVNPFIDLLEAVYPAASIIHMSRHPAVIAEEIHRKRWFDDANLYRPSNRQVFRRVRVARKDCYVPFWVKPGKVEAFVAMTEKERACLYPWHLYRLSAESLGRAGKPAVKFAFYEDVLRDPSGALRMLFPGAKSGAQTAELLSEIGSRGADRVPGEFRHDFEGAAAIHRRIPGFKKRYAA